MAAAFISQVSAISLLILEAKFSNSSSLHTSTCDIRVTTGISYSGSATTETDFSAFAIFPNSLSYASMQSTTNWEAGVDGLFCRAVTVVENALTATSSWKCSKATTTAWIKAPTINFKENGGTLVSRGLTATTSSPGGYFLSMFEVSLKYGDLPMFWSASKSKSKIFNTYILPTSSNPALLEVSQAWMFQIGSYPISQVYNKITGAIQVNNQQECEDGFASWTTGNTGRLLQSGGAGQTIFNFLFTTVFLI